MTLKASSRLLTAITLTFISLSASANNDFKFNGFINVIGSLSNSETSYLDDINDNGSFSSTNLGIVLSKQINSKTNIATQFHGKQDSYSFDWGYISYRYQADVTLKAGKIKYPGNLVSETIDIGITFPWVRAPIAIYGEQARLSYESYTGSSLLYTGGDDIEYSAEVFLGEADGEGVLNERMFGLVLVATTDNIRAQASFNSSVMQLLNFNPNNPNQALMNDTTMTNVAFGVKAEYEIATILAEYSQTTMSNSQSLENIGWYLTMMHETDSWTPHITYQSYEGMFGRDETSFGLGVNKKLNLATVLKFGLEFIEPTNSGFFEQQPDDNTVTVFNISLNMVF